MEKDFKFLTTINGFYSPLNMVDTLTVFYNSYLNRLKICYKSVIITDDPADNINVDHKKSKIETGEILLDLGFMEYELIYNNTDKQCIKELIFYKYLDMTGSSLYFEVY